MKKMFAITVVLLITLSSLIKASEESHRKSIEELFDVMKIKEIEIESFRQFKQTFMYQMQRFMMSMEDTKKVKSIQDNIQKILDKEFNWDNLKNEYINIYVEIFTEKDVAELIKFYKSPLGQKLMERTPELMDRSTQIGEKHMTVIMPGIENMLKKEGCIKESQYDSGRNDKK